MLFLCEEINALRLPTNIKPIHYKISLDIDISKCEFEGETTISTEVLRRSQEIYLHSCDLEIESIRLTNINTNLSAEPSNIEVIKKTEMIKLSFANRFPAGYYQLHVKYDGYFDEQCQGINYVKYNEKNVALFTHFRPDNAHKVFPCFDEPALKATFELSLTISREFTALSNMPVKSIDKISKDLRRYNFMRTPLMSSYLVGFAVGEFKHIQAQTEDAVIIRVNFLENEEEETSFALDIALKSMKFFKELLGVPYALPKLDLVTVPESTHDADDNWGIIMFRDANLITKKEESIDSNGRWISLTIMHQIAHQWFGNLVTFEWWSGIWFHEALCNFIENQCADFYFFKYKIWQDFVLGRRQTAILLDEFAIHPIEITIENPKDTNCVFDGIGINKGVSIIRMLNDFVGDESFKKSLNFYINKYAYSNSSADDFFGILEEVTRKPIRCMMATWTQLSSFPVVSASTTPGCHCESTRKGVTLKLTQTAFRREKSKVDDTIWKIPITLITSNKKKNKMSFLMDTREMAIFLPDLGEEDWIELNPGFVGYYRVQYSPEMLQKLWPPIKNCTLSVMDRISILEDLSRVVKYGFNEVNDLIRTLKEFDHERDFVVWSAIMRVLKQLAILLNHSNLEEDFKRLQEYLNKKMLVSMGWVYTEEDSDEHFITRLTIGEMSWLDDQKVIEKTRERFQKNVFESELPDYEKVFCYHSTVPKGNQEFESLLKLYKTVDTYEERRNICYQLASVDDEDKLRKILTFAMSNETNPSLTSLIILTITSTKKGRDFLWSYYKNHWREILDNKENSNKESLARMILEVKEKFADESVGMDVETFISKRLPVGEKHFHDVLRTLHENSKWSENDLKVFQRFPHN